MAIVEFTGVNAGVRLDEKGRPIVEEKEEKEKRGRKKATVKQADLLKSGEVISRQVILTREEYEMLQKRGLGLKGLVKLFLSAKEVSFKW